MAAADPTEAIGLPPGLVPAGTTELGIDIIKVDRIRAALERFGPRFSKRVLTEPSSATCATGPRRWPAAGRPRRRSRRCWGSASGASAGATSRSSGCRPGSPRSGSTVARRPVPSSSGWSGSRSRSPTNRTTRWRSPSASARPAAGTSSRPTSRIASTSASAGSWPGSSGCARRPRPAAPRRSPRTPRQPIDAGAAACLSGGRSGSAGATARRGAGETDAGRAFPAGATQLDDDVVAALLPERPARGHKGSFGKLLVIAGSLDYAGAALLVCRAAGRSGVGLVTLAVPESLQPLFAAKVVEATTMALPEDDVEEIDPEPALARILDHEHDAIVVGPGPAPGPGHDRARPVAAADRGRDRRRADRARRRGAPLDGHDGRLVGRASAGRPS